MRIATTTTSSLFYFGTLLSSIGSMALSVAMVSFMLAQGFDLLRISIVIGVSRFVPVVISLFIGHKLDRFSPRTTIVSTEILAAVASAILLLGWNTFDRNFLMILSAMVLRSVFTSAQTGSRAQITKLLSSPDYQSNSKNAIWLNKVTQGATLFGAVIAWSAVKYSSFESVIIFDAVTFIANGLILLLLPLSMNASENRAQVSFFQKFRDLYGLNRWAASLDFLLVVSVMGASSFAARLAGTREDWMPLFVLSYGLAVWVAGYVERLGIVQRQRVTIWIVLAASLAALGQFHSPSLAMWTVCFIKDLAFWILFHRITAHIQTDTPKSLISSVTFARNAQVISIFAVGEVVVGAWKPVLTLESECVLRACVCAGAVALLMIAGQREQHEKARL